MSGGTLIQWLALCLCVVFAAVRLPDAVRGRGRGVFVVLLLLALAVALSLAPIYLFVDSLLGGVNVANLLIRFSLYAMVLLLGVRCASAFHSSRARKSVSGPAGLAAVGLTAVATLTLFLMSDLPESSTGLQAYSDQATVKWYADLGRIYPAYVAACLIGPAFSSARDNSARVSHRLAAGLIMTGFAMVVVSAAVKLVNPVSVGPLEVLLPFGAIVLVTVGLALIWASRRRASRSRSANLLTEE